jgi:hypothetical protein
METNQTATQGKAVPFTDMVKSSEVKYVLVEGVWYEIQVGSFAMRSPFIKFTTVSVQGILMDVEIFPTALQGWGYVGESNG